MARSGQRLTLTQTIVLGRETELGGTHETERIGARPVKRSDSSGVAQNAFPPECGSVVRMKTEHSADQFDPIVDAALRELTGYNNLQTHNDRDEAIQALRLLRAQGHSIDPPAIYAWALRHPDEWDVDGARELRKVAEGVVVNRAFKLRTNDALVDMTISARWSERASKPSR